MLPCVWFSDRSQKTPKCGKNVSDTLGCASCATLLFLPHFDVICDLLLNRRTATWNLFVNSITSGILWLAMLLTIYSVIVGEWTSHVLLSTKWRVPPGVFEVFVKRTLIKLWVTIRFILRQLDYSLSISMHDSWLGLRPQQLSHFSINLLAFYHECRSLIG